MDSFTILNINVHLPIVFNTWRYIIRGTTYCVSPLPWVNSHLAHAKVCQFYMSFMNIFQITTEILNIWYTRAKILVVILLLICTNYFQHPENMAISLPSLSMRTFSNFISRWMMPFL